MESFFSPKSSQLYSKTGEQYTETGGIFHDDPYDDNFACDCVLGAIIAIGVLVITGIVALLIWAVG